MPIRGAVIMVLTFVFGIVPATMLVTWAIVIGAVGFTGLFLFGGPLLVGSAHLVRYVVRTDGQAARGC